MASFSQLARSSHRGGQGFKSPQLHPIFAWSETSSTDQAPLIKRSSVRNPSAGRAAKRRARPVRGRMFHHVVGAFSLVRSGVLVAVLVSSVGRATAFVQVVRGPAWLGQSLPDGGLG